ncbi:MAG: NAD-dependent epimerase/dehydratase family protein [Armatimonadetes bacterium]|nr:NAD-dependent epimerase/dehydratase family protein [Armatimonadota bacterium]
MTRVVLFGGSGFVGSNLLRYIDIEMLAPSEFDADLTRIESLLPVIEPGDIVVNAAGYANATDRSKKGRALFQQVNVDGLANLAKACAEKNVAQLVHLSSVAAMGRWNGQGITEDMMRPVKSPYAASKLEGERLLCEFQDRLPITILRPTSVFGEGRGLARSLCSFVERGIIPLPRGGRATIPFTYIGNVARAVELSLGNPECLGRKFIIGDERSYPLREVVLALAKAMGRRPRIISVPTPIWWAAALGIEIVARVGNKPPLLDRGRLDTMTCSVSYSIAAFQKATGYTPPFGLQEACERIAAWYLGQRTDGERAL